MAPVELRSNDERPVTQSKHLRVKRVVGLRRKSLVGWANECLERHVSGDSRYCTSSSC